MAPLSLSRRRALAGAGLVGLLALPGCRYLPFLDRPAAPPPPSAPESVGVDAGWRLETRPIGGSPIAREDAVRAVEAGVAGAAGAEAAAEDAGTIAEARPTEFRARVRLIEIADPSALPTPQLPTWIFARTGGEPLQPAPRFTAGAAAGWLDESLALFDAGAGDAASGSASASSSAKANDGKKSNTAAAATTAARVRAEIELPLGPGAGWSLAPRADGGEAIELLLWTDATGELGAALAAEGHVARLELDDAQAAAIGAVARDLVERRDGFEIAPLPAADGRRTVWARVPTTGTRALVLVAHAEPAPTEGAEGLAHAREIADLRRAFEELHVVPVVEPLLALARDGAGRRRALLVELTRSANRPLGTDLVLFADDATLARWTKSATERGMSTDRTEQAWALERAALLDQAREADAGHQEPSLAAVLRVHLGPIGTEPALLADAVRRAKGPKTFAEMLIAETETLLSDPRPSVRVRATKWLAERGLGPSAFDPLADRATRRAALDAWRSSKSEGGAR